VVLAFALGVLVGHQMMAARLQHLVDAHARHQAYEDEYPNHNIPYYRGAKRITVVGDSISTSHYRPHGTDAEYPFLVASAIRASVTNLSVPGWETDAMIAHAVPVVARDSDIVIYEGGTNDLIYTGISALPRIDRVISAIRAQAPHAKIIIVGLRDFGRAPNQSIIAWNKREESVAAPAGAAYVDLYSAFPASDRAEWPDGVHPNSAGAHRLAGIIERAITANATKTRIEQ
jgi:lysophospholipase L1-like esterase